MNKANIGIKHLSRPSHITFAWDILRDSIAEAENRYGLILHGRVDADSNYAITLKWVCLDAGLTKNIILTYEILSNFDFCWAAVEDSLKRMAEKRDERLPIAAWSKRYD